MRVVGIGASAGGLEAFTQLLKHLPADTGMCFVLVQHLDPHHNSALPHLLGGVTAMPVREVKNNARVQANCVYVIPPKVTLSISGGLLKLKSRRKNHLLYRPIDSFFESLAQDQQERAIGIVLSGTASDGTLGLEAIKAEGGVTFAQDESAKYDSMPRSAIAAGVVDVVLSPEKIAAELARIARHPVIADKAPEPSTRSQRQIKQHAGHAMPSLESGRPLRAGSKISRTAPAEIAEDNYKRILSLLRKHSGVDFTPYKSSTLQRRINRRMLLTRNVTIHNYADHLQGNSKELDALYSDVLIGVTSFFRNPEAFETLKRKVFPRILKKRGRDEPVRVWVLGCSTGQEAYSIAMAYAESTEKLTRVPTLQIFATDLNEAVLEKARRGLYAKTLANDISPERLRRFFVEEEGGYRVSKSLREQIVFAKQNLVSDPPFSRMDLISCRNLLIYLEPGSQKKIMPAFHYALRPGGFLFLGASESAGQFTDLFAPLNKKQKIFFKKATGVANFRAPLPERSVNRSRALPTARSMNAQPLPREELRVELNAQREADRLLVNQYAPPGVLIDDDHQVFQFRGATGSYLEPPAGKASFDVLKMARPGLMLPLRRAINKAKRENKPVRVEKARLEQNGTIRAVNLQVIPLKHLKERCYLVLFEDAPKTKGARSAPVSPPQILLSKREESRRISSLEAELSETRDYLQSMQEQHESANEALQASNEEIQSANEELQSINEELETSKEELESTNEELITVNEEMTTRNTELNRLNADVNNLQTSINTPILLLGRDLSLRRFTPAAEKMFNLLATDVGRPLSAVRHNLDFPDLEHFVREVIDTVSAREREISDRTDRLYLLRARPYMTTDNKIDGAVLVVMDIDAIKRSEKEVNAAREFAQSIVDNVPPLLILDNHLRVVSANESFYSHFKVNPVQTHNCLIYDLGNGQWNIPALRTLLEEILPRKNTFNDMEVTHNFESIGPRTMLLHARQLDHVQQIMLRIDDITERRHIQAELRRSERRYLRLLAALDGILILDPVSRKITDANAFMVRLLGYSREEFLGKELWEFGLIKDEQASHVAFRELQQKGFIQYDDFPLQSKNGEKRDVQLVASLYQEDDREIIQCNIRDVTERKATERISTEQRQRFEREREALLANEQSFRMEAEAANRAKDLFLATLSHELRTPLNAIIGWTSILKNEEYSEEDVREGIEVIDRNVTAQAQLIEDVLDISRIISGKLKLDLRPSELSTIINDALDIVRPAAQTKEVELVVDLDSSASAILCDAVRIQQVTWNLLSNAVKFTPKGGNVRISLFRQQSETIIRVSDSGRGIRAEFLPFVFDRFRQADSSSRRLFGGLGLGLSIVKHLVELHGGAVRAESNGDGQGSTFTVALPIRAVQVDETSNEDEENIEARQPNRPAAPLVRLDGLRILVVDDEHDARRLLTKVLRGVGAIVESAASVAEALNLLSKMQPQILISDIGMPEMDGFDLIRKVRSSQDSSQAIPAIALTAFAQKNDTKRIMDAGFQLHVPKPVDPRDLITAIARIAKLSPQTK
jgi:two-component system CheB/CheR fusion protein